MYNDVLLCEVWGGILTFVWPLASAILVFLEIGDPDPREATPTLKISFKSLHIDGELDVLES